MRRIWLYWRLITILIFIFIIRVFESIINQLLSKGMFRDDNDEFMKSFGGEEDQPLEVGSSKHQIPVVNQAASKKLRRYCENASFNMVSEQSDQKSFNSRQNEPLEAPVQIERQEIQSKRINWIKQTMPTSRKFSDANLVVSIKRFQDDVDSEFNMPCIDQESEAVSSQMIDNRSRYQDIDAPELKENEPPEEDPETYYMKKMRLLETKFKQLNLLYENMVMQLKKQNKQISDELEVYKEHIKKYQPTLQAQIKKVLEEKQENMSFFSSSSDSSKKSQDISMPVISQIMEVKIQGKKLCDTVKELSNKIKELEMVNEEHCYDTTNKSTSSFLNPDNISPFPKSPSKHSPMNPSKRSDWCRKYSIPAIYSRQKKQSFQTTIISGREQNDSSNKQKSTVVCTEYTKNAEENGLAASTNL